MTDQTATSEVEYQVGAHDVDTQTVAVADTTEFVEFELESRAVFKRLADDIYTHKKAGIREPLTNAITAVNRAVDEGYIPEDRGVIELTLHFDDDAAMLVIRDNGIGITRAELNEVVSVIGRSTARDDAELAGQFGMGFLAMFKLTGTDGGFIMHTNARRTDNDPLSGVWKSGGFSPDTDNALPNRFDDNEYGTEFRIPLKTKPDRGEFADYIEEYAEYARIPVIFRRYDEDGNEDFNEDYGQMSLENLVTTDDHDNNYDHAIIDTPYYKAVSGHQHNDRLTLLLDVPIDRNNRASTPWGDFAIRLKNENATVVDGPHEGLQPVSRAEYTDMDADRQPTYIPEDELHDDDIVMPGPTGTRDELAAADEFWEYVSAQFNARYEEAARDLLTSLDTVSDLAALDEVTYEFLVTDLLPSPGSGTDADQYNDQLESNYGVRAPTPIARIFTELFTTFDVVRRDSDRPELRSNHNSTPLYRILPASSWEGDNVYMGKSINSWKAQVAHELDGDNLVVRVEDTDAYETYADLFGWQLLKNIRESRLDDLAESQAEKQRLLDLKEDNDEESDADDTDLSENYLHIHVGWRKTEASNFQISDIEQWFDPSADFDDYYRGRSRPSELLILVPRSSSRAVKHHNTWLTSKKVGVAACTDAEWEYFEENDVPGVVNIDEYFETAESMSFQTSAGEHTVASAKDAGKLLIHPVSPELYELFSEEERMTQMTEVIANESWSVDKSRYGFDDDYDPSDIIYAPLPVSQVQQLRPVLQETSVASTSSYRGPMNGVSLPNNHLLYLALRLPEWRGTETFEYLQSLMSSRSTSLDDERFHGFVETLGMLHDAGIAPADATERAGVGLVADD